MHGVSLVSRMKLAKADEAQILAVNVIQAITTITTTARMKVLKQMLL